jgi:hypothetical protein
MSDNMQHNGAEKTGPAPLPPQPQGPAVTFNGLLQQEADAIQGGGDEPNEYIGLVVGASDMQLLLANPQNGAPLYDPQGNRILVAVLQVALPQSVLPILPQSVLLDSSGQGVASKAHRAICRAAPPQVRLVVRRDALADTVQAQLAAMEEAAANTPPPESS